MWLSSALCTSLTTAAARRPRRKHATFPVLCVALAAQVASAVTFTPAPAANLDLSQLGRVGLVGDFDGISLYEFEGQTENAVMTNGSQAVLARLPNGAFTSLAVADASIMSMCSFVMGNGNMAGVIVGGNFTSLNGMNSQAVALLNPNTSAVTPLTGISGKVAAVLCDESTNTVFVGGSFTAANSTNAIAWVGTAGWTNLPFLGFNGPVTSITKAANGHIIFGGTFTGLGNASAPVTPDAQIINLSNATISALSSTTTTGLSDPRNILCKTGATDGAGNTWLLADDSAGSWSATFGFGFQPTKLRLYNTHLNGRGTKTWRYTALPINGIMNFTYTDPTTGKNASCTSECPLSDDASVPYQDFHFVNVIGMNAIRIDISAWYGSGGGLDGIELFQDNILSYAVNAFNEPACATISTASLATTTGPWAVSPSFQSSSEYLMVNITASGYTPADTQVVFLPDVKQSGNYTVNMFTPGCVQDGTCATRQQINITGSMTSGSTFQTMIYQSNNFDKYDQIFSGYVAAGTGSFRPSVTLRPVAGQTPPMTVVAQNVQFILTEASSGGLNSIFEWNPALASVNTSDFTTSVFDQAGVVLGTSAGVQAFATSTSTSTTYVGGNFTTATFDNVFAITSTGTASLAGDGLNGQVLTLLLNGTNLFVGGGFTNTKSASATGLNNIAVYDTSAKSWTALGAGVNGRVVDVVTLTLNITSSVPETVIAVTGNFQQLNAFGINGASTVNGFAIWVPSQSNWLENLNISTTQITGQLSTSVSVAYGGNSGTLWAGSVSASQLGADGAVELGSNSLSAFPINIKSSTGLSASSSSLSKRATSAQNVTGVVTGLFYETASRNITILGGNFAATASDGSTVNNLAFINGSNSNAVTGLGSALSNSSTVLALAVQNDTLFAGGVLSGTVNGNAIAGLITYNFATNSFPVQPPALAGTNVAAHSLNLQPNTANMFVGGSFDNAGSLACPGVCTYNIQAAQWNRPGTTLSGTANTMLWASTTTLLVGGALVISGASTPLAQYNTQTSAWTAFNGAGIIPGTITTMTAANGDASQLWVAGTATNGTTFLMFYDGSNWNVAGSALGSSTTIRGLQVLPLTTNHASTSLVPANQDLLVTGSLSLTGIGNVSAALFNGTTFMPFALTTSSTPGSSGSLSSFFSQQQNFFTTSSGSLALGFIVLIGLGCALALVFLIVVAGVLLDRYRRKRDGYMPAPTNMYDKSTQIGRVPPEQLFGRVGRPDAGAPMI